MRWALQQPDRKPKKKKKLRPSRSDGLDLVLLVSRITYIRYGNAATKARTLSWFTSTRQVLMHTLTEGNGNFVPPSLKTSCVWIQYQRPKKESALSPPLKTLLALFRTLAHGTFLNILFHLDPDLCLLQQPISKQLITSRTVTFSKKTLLRPDPWRPSDNLPDQELNLSRNQPEAQALTSEL